MFLGKLRTLLLLKGLSVCPGRVAKAIGITRIYTGVENTVLMMPEIYPWDYKS
jgi:hypothetical protein